MQQAKDSWVPAGDRIIMRDGRLDVPDLSASPVMQGDGIGADIMAAAMTLWNAAVEVGYQGDRQISRLDFMWRRCPAGNLVSRYQATFASVGQKK